MYFPYLRGKQFELEALLDVNPRVYQNTLPILEPINFSHLRLYTRITNQSIPLLLVVNPFYPRSGTLGMADVQTVIDNQLASHSSLVLGFIIDQRFDLTDLNVFLTDNADREKALIFRSNPVSSHILDIQSAINLNPVNYLIFDDNKTTNRTRNSFTSAPRILITDGFQRQDRNADYPLSSAFDSNYSTWQADGWHGIGDYVTIGDFYRDGGGQAYVISLHITTNSPNGLIMHHFSSISHSSSPGFSALKFSEANNLLVTSPHVSPLTSEGLSLYRGWHSTAHNPSLGAAKKASIMHHIEVMSGLV